MNDSQFEALRKYDFAKAQVRLKGHELKAAITRSVAAAKELKVAIKLDQAAWDETPNKQAYIEGEVIENGETTEGEVQEAPTLLAPPTEPRPHIP